MPTFLVTLATGHQGSRTARELLQDGHEVHALVRDRSAPAALVLSQNGATIYEGTFNDPDVLREAVYGTEGIFLNLVPDGQDAEAEVRATRRVLEAARGTETVKTIVLSTALKTGLHPKLREQNPNYTCNGYFESKYRSEQAVLSSGFPHITILRPGWLMHNNIAPFSSFHFPELEAERVLATACQPETRMAYFDADDVGKFAADALMYPDRYAGKIIELGSENLTTEMAAEMMSRQAGVKIEVRYRSAAEIEEMSSKVPTLPFHVFANEHSFEAPEGSLDEYGIRLTTFEEFLQRESDRLQKGVGQFGG